MKLHPLAVFGAIKKLLFLLIIPIIRGLLSLDGGIAGWLSGVWFDILVLAAIISLAVARCVGSRIRTDAEGITVEDGVLVRSFERYPYSGLAVLGIKRTPLLKLFGAAQAELRGIGFRRRLVLYSRDVENLPVPGIPVMRCRTPADAVGGAVFLASVLAFGGKLLGRDLRGEVTETLLAAFAGGVGIILLLLGGYALLWYDAGTKFSSFRADGECVRLTFRRLRELCAVELPRERIVRTDVSRSLPQRLRGSCTLRVSWENRRCTLRALNAGETYQTLGEIGWKHANIL